MRVLLSEDYFEIASVTACAGPCPRHPDACQTRQAASFQPPRRGEWPGMVIEIFPQDSRANF